MRTQLTMNALALALGLVSSAAFAEVAISVKVSGVETEQGKVQAKLFSEATQDGFPGGKPLQLLTADAKRDGVTLTFRVAQPGYYAVVATHDVNGNGKVDTNMLGIPQEPIGNSGEPAKGKPTFKASQFCVDQANVDIAIKLR